MNTPEPVVLETEPQSTIPPGRGGPKTAEGKAASRRNALKFGLHSKVVFPEEFETLVEARVGEFSDEFAPRTPYEQALVRDMAVASARVERVASFAAADLVRVANRAFSTWDDDRRMSVENFAVGLSKEPARVAAGLRRSKQGADWLIERWDILAKIARETGRWADHQRSLAFDMLGIPVQLRDGTFLVPEGTQTAQIIELAEREIAKLIDDQQAVLDELSEAERAMAMSGMSFEEDAATAGLRKAEARARRDLAKARNEFLRVRDGQPPKEAKPRPATRDDRPPLPDAAVTNYIKRTHLPQTLIEAEIGQNEPEATPQPESKVSRPNRRARKEMARREREQARHKA